MRAREYSARHAGKEQPAELEGGPRALEQALHEARTRHESVAVLCLCLAPGERDAPDEWTRQMLSLLRRTLRGPDTVAPLEYGEFVIVLPGAGAESAIAVGSRVLDRLDGARSRGAVGIALHPLHGLDSGSLLERARAALSAALRVDSRCAVFSAAPDQDQALALASELARAIDRDELVLYFQPKVVLRTGKVMGVEALVRWNHLSRGLLPPDQFVPLAERMGLVRSLSRWVLNAALRQCRAWHDAGLDVPVTVNLSMHNLHDPHLPDLIVELLNAWNVPAGRLRLEVTESALMVDPLRATEALRRLRQLGVRVAIDDFGTGYSSLSYLKHLPADQLKIDRSFVREMRRQPSDQIIVRFTIDLGHALGLEVVAEGVEDAETSALLLSLGCDGAQGYLLSPPLPAAAAESWLRSRCANQAGSSAA